MHTFYYIAAGAAILGLVALFVPMLLNAATSGPLRFVEEPGEDHWFGPPWRRFRFWWGLTFSGEASMRVVFEEPAGDPDTSFKLFGLSAISLKGLWPWTAERVRRYGWGEYSNLAHEDCPRFVVVWRAGRWRISTYTYIGGRGGISGPDVPKPPRRVLAAIAPGEAVTLTIRIAGGELTYLAKTGEGASHQRLDFPVWAFAYMKHFAHSKGVTSDTAVPIAFTASK